MTEKESKSNDIVILVVGVIFIAIVILFLTNGFGFFSNSAKTNSGLTTSGSPSYSLSPAEDWRYIAETTVRDSEDHNVKAEFYIWKGQECRVVYKETNGEIINRECTGTQQTEMIARMGRY